MKKSEVDTARTLTGEDEGPTDVDRSETLSRGAEQGRASEDDTITLNVASPGREATRGQEIAGRYKLVDRLGEGAHGEVWTASDLVLREPVALKLMLRASRSFMARVRREITTLRMLRIPGVVQLLDEGIEEGRPFLVMERVEGKPFPGRAAPRGEPRLRWAWADLVGPTLSLLEVLARVHVVGVVHRDLKPDNILVSAEGRPTVLDFGVSLWQETTGRLTGAGQIIGTPRYLAPEQICDRAVDPRTDLYAVGVMLYEALAGEAPHEAPDIPSLFRRRLQEPAPPVQDLAPEVPAAVAYVVDRLLSLRMEDRFRSASEVLSALRGEPAAALAALALPRLGDGSAVQAVLDATAAGRSIDVVGPPGAGRTRCLKDVAEALAGQGRRTARAEPAGAPLASLRPVVDVPEEQAGLQPTDVMARVEADLRAALAAGVVVLADDADRLDPWSGAVMERCRRGPGTIVRALSDAPPGAREEEIARLEPLDEAALRPLFAGPDRLFHLREDAARALWERTEGLPARMEAEVTLWTRLGLARWDGARLVVDRDALGRLGSGALGTAPARAAPEAHAGEPHMKELLQWLALGGHHLEPSQLAQAMGQPVGEIKAACDALVSRGVARRRKGQRVVPHGQVDMIWTPARRLEVHRAIAHALRPGQEGRLFHLLATEQVREVAAEATAVAERHARSGDLGAAVAALAEGLRAVRHHADSLPDEAEIQILAAWVKAAFAEGTQHARDRVMYELSRARGRGPAQASLEALVRAASAASGPSGARALALVDGIPPFANPELERWRQRARVRAAVAPSSSDLLEGVLVEIEAWAERSGELQAELSLAEGRARVRYGQGQFKEAAVLHVAAAELDPWLTGRIAAILSCASALLEAFLHEEAAERAASARELAARCRHPFLEGRAEWLLRAARYRMGEATAPDLELVELVERLGMPSLEALVCLNEAAVAFRVGRTPVAAELAGRAAAVRKRMEWPSGELLARCLALSCGAKARDGEVQELAARAVKCTVSGVGLQALGLLGRAFPEARGGWAESVEGLVKGIPRVYWALRIDVLSVEEALAWARGEGEVGG